MIKYKYFFGSDERSLNFLNTIYAHYNEVKVVTLEPKKIGRGRKITPNPVQIYCQQNDIEYSYYQEENIYEDMEYGIVASFAKIFTNNFLTNNKPLFNIHLSLLPKYKGPTPVESALLNLEKFSGYTIFKINKNVDTGDIIYQKRVNIDGKYATEVYQQIYESFHIDILNIDFNKKGQIQESIVSNTRKFFKEDFNIQELTIQNAKTKIRAFDYLGPAFLKYNNINLKILSYSEIEQGSSIELSGGLLYPLNVIPEGKSKMLFEDYLRGLK
ncbi:formyltransferase family protein [Acidimicrobiaceae bacterium]|nr:formyltransferase family protein [Acidimicrobiaceae bacterium]